MAGGGNRTCRGLQRVGPGQGVVGGSPGQRLGVPCKELGTGECGVQGAWEMCRVGDRAADGRLVLAVLCWGWILPAHETSMCHFQDCCQAVVGLLVP